MAVRLTAVTPVRNVTRLVVKQSSPLPKTRQFTCTAIRAKEVANQEELPNLRHAQRPRKCSTSLYNTEFMLISLCSWRKTTRANCESNR